MWIKFGDKEPVWVLAKLDLMVYKRLDITPKGLLSPYRGFKYELGKRYEQKIARPEMLTISNKLGPAWRVMEAIHSYETLGKAREQSGSAGALFECIIPEGSYYMVNRGSMVVSSAIKIVKLVKQ